MSTYEVIKYVKLRFGKNWTCNLLADAVMEYKVDEKEEAPLLVIAEGDSGLFSYHFTLTKHDIVYVIGDIVHISGKYKTRSNGNEF